MKRSEVVKIIADFIYELNVDPEECDKKAEELLLGLEKAGMLPPTVEFEMAGKTVKDNTWQAEDE